MKDGQVRNGASRVDSSTCQLHSASATTESSTGLFSNPTSAEKSKVAGGDCGSGRWQRGIQPK
eukprot:1578621-Amphidinium_carterae.2